MKETNWWQDEQGLLEGLCKAHLQAAGSFGSYGLMERHSASFALLAIISCWIYSSVLKYRDSFGNSDMSRSLVVIFFT